MKDYDQKMAKAVADAQVASDAAGREYVAAARKCPNGFVIDTCGYSNLSVLGPSRKFLSAYRRLGFKRYGSSGEYVLCSPVVTQREQSITAEEVAANAAMAVFADAFPDETFSVSSRID